MIENVIEYFDIHPPSCSKSIEIVHGASAFATAPSNPTVIDYEVAQDKIYVNIENIEYQETI